MWPFTPKDWRDTYRSLSDSELLNRIRNGDERATDYLMETYQPIALQYAQRILFGKSEALGEPGDYAHDALLLLWTRAYSNGAAVLNHDRINGWLRQAITFHYNNAFRKEQKHWRDTGTDDEEDPVESTLTRIADQEAHRFADKHEKEVFEIVEEVLANYPEKKKEPPFETLVRNRWIACLSWKDTAAVMLRLHPDHKPAFDVTYVVQSYWGRNHRNIFFPLLRQALKRYGYDS